VRGLSFFEQTFNSASEEAGRCQVALYGSTPVIKNSEPNFRKGSEILACERCATRAAQERAEAPLSRQSLAEVGAWRLSDLSTVESKPSARGGGSVAYAGGTGAREGCERCDRGGNGLTGSKFCTRRQSARKRKGEAVHLAHPNSLSRNPTSETDSSPSSSKT
jgi:hypothetical protein